MQKGVNLKSARNYLHNPSSQSLVKKKDSQKPASRSNRAEYAPKQILPYTPNIQLLVHYPRLNSMENWPYVKFWLPKQHFGHPSNILAT